jgi:molybdopterin converting factor small subunit
MTPTLRVLFLGPLRGRLSRDAIEVPCPPDGNPAAFRRQLEESFPALQGQSYRLARGDEFLPADAILQPGDEIALVPPVSGG